MRLRVVLGLLAGLTAATVAAWWFGIRPGELEQRLRGVSPWLLVGCAGSSFVVLGLQALRWHQVRRPQLGLRYGRALAAQLVGTALNVVLPGRGGDLLRVEYLARRTGKSRATILGTEVVDRWLDWWGWFPVLALVATFGGVPCWLRKGSAAMALALAVSAALLVFVCRRRDAPCPATRVGAIFHALRLGLRSFGTRRTLLIALFVAPLPWLWEACALLGAARATGLPLTFAMAFWVLVAFNFAMLIPLPGGIGSVEAGGTAALVYFGVDRSTALAFMVVYHLTQLLPMLAAGAALVVGEPGARGRLRAGRKADANAGVTSARGAAWYGE